MKFDCGESWSAKRKRLEEWHDYFALIPRMVDEHDCRWLETIQRSGYYFGPDFGWNWYFRAKE